MWYSSRRPEDTTFKVCKNTPVKQESTACSDSLKFKGEIAHKKYLGLSVVRMCDRFQQLPWLGYVFQEQPREYGDGDDDDNDDDDS